MENVLKLIFYLIIWVFVPAVMAAAIWFLATIHKKSEIKSRRHSARAGFWAGFMLFVIILIYQINIFLKIGFPHDPLFKGFNLALSLATALVIFIIATPAVMASWLILLLTFISFFGLFHYIFIRMYNDIILSVVMGVAFGFLAHLAASLSSVTEFLSRKDHFLE